MELLWKKVCYKIALYENRQHKSCKAFTGLSKQKWSVGDIPLSINLLLKVNYLVARERMPATQINNKILQHLQQ